MRICDWSSDVCSSDLPCADRAREQHERFNRKRQQRYARPMCERMARGQGNQHVLIDDGLDAQAIVAAVNGPHECDIDRVTADRRDQAGCCPFFKRECDVWIAATELADDLRDQWMERRGIDPADADAAEFATGDPARVIAGERKSTRLTSS